MQHDDFDISERASEHESGEFPHDCYNCHCTQIELLDFWPEDEPHPVFACDDCAAEQRRLETLADELAAMPSCEERERIFNLTGLSVRQLVNLLEAHDRRCACGGLRRAA